MTNLEYLPAPLRERASFCCWRYEERNGRRTKVPYNPRTGGMAQSNNPETFAPLAVAAGAMERYDGLGVGIFGDLGAIDIDHCIGDAGPSELARDIILTMDSYTELSPSGTGIRILFWAPDFQYDTGRYYINNQKRGLEVYIAGCTKKYVTVTGNVYGIEEMAERSAQLQQVLEKYMVRPTVTAVNSPPAQTVEQDDVALLERAKSARNGDRFARLWAGDICGYQSQSEADLALCNQLAFWTGRDPARMDRLFRQSGLMRDKWDRRQSGSTYGAITIQNAIRSCGEVYEPRREAPQRQPELETVSAAALMDMQLSPVQWVVVDLIPSGFNLLASPPKYGKSWWVLDLCLSVAAGTAFLGWETVQGRCLYLALEDSRNRLQTRLKKLLGGQAVPTQFDFAVQAADLDHGLLEQLGQYVKAHPDTRLIVIDTFQKVRGEARRSEGAYQTDYREAGRLKTFADAHHVAVLCVHHLRKMADDSDPFNRISGTNGISGAADTMLVMTRNKRTDANTTLSITGRDVEMSEEILTFEKDSCRWRRIGTADHLTQQAARMGYDQEPMVQAVQALVERYPEGWEGTAAELMEECGRILGFYPETSVKSYTPALKRLKAQLYNYDRILVDAKTRVHGKIRLKIYRAANNGAPFAPLQTALSQEENS